MWMAAWQMACLSETPALRRGCARSRARRRRPRRSRRRPRRASEERICEARRTQAWLRGRDARWARSAAQQAGQRERRSQARRSVGRRAARRAGGSLAERAQIWSSVARRARALPRRLAAEMGARSAGRRRRWAIPTRAWTCGMRGVTRKSAATWKARSTRVRRFRLVTTCRRGLGCPAALRRARPRRPSVLRRVRAGGRAGSAGPRTGRSRQRRNPGSSSQITWMRTAAKG